MLVEASALGIAVAGLTLPSLVYVRTGRPRIALASLLRPLTRALAKRAAAKGTLSPRAALGLLASGDPGPLHLLAGRACIDPGLLAEAVALGVPEPVSLSKARGCRVPVGLEPVLATFYVLAGEAKYAGLHGAAPARVVAATCKPRIEVSSPHETYSETSLPHGPLRLRAQASFDPEAAAASLGAEVVVSWGCTGGLDARLLVAAAYPEIPLSIAGLSYHLGLQGPPSRVVLQAAGLAARVLLESGAWRYLGVEKWRLEALAAAAPSPPEPPEGIVVTDKPRAGLPTWSPLALDLPGEKPEEVPGPVWAALVSLARRGGDPEAVREEHPALRGLADAARRYAAPRRGQPTGGFQVLPSHASKLRLGSTVLDCLVPEEVCAREAGVAYRPREPDRVYVHTGSPAARSVVHAAAMAVEEWGPEGLLLVAPSRAAAIAVSSSLGVTLVEGHESVDEWMAYGEPGVVAWDDLRRMPEAVAAASRIVTLFPEKFPGVPGDVGAVLRLAWKLGGYTVSRALYYEAPGRAELAGSPDAGDPGIQVSMEALVGEAERVFGRHWPGYRLRPYQRVAVGAVLESMVYRPGSPVLVVLPTGAGKSAIFQVSGLVGLGLGLGGYVLVVSPLRALMRDQVDSAKRRGLRAARIDSGVPGRERRRALDLARRGLLDILYITPERLQDEALQRLLLDAPPALVVLDEAHTLARWGPSFRPSYLYAAKLLADIREAEAWPPLALFTATAPPDLARQVLAAVGVYEAVEEPLPLDREEPVRVPEGKGLILRGPVVRPELTFEVVPAEEGEARVRQAAGIVRGLAEWASKVSEPWVGIVYTGFVRRTRDTWANAEELAERLAEEAGIETLSYHGQLTGRERRRREDLVYQASSTGEGPRVVVATKAFGMGVDIPNIRWVLHFTASDSIEDYYQEAGRAGRDGLPARIVSLYSPRDFQERLRMARAQRILPSMVVSAYNTLYRLWSRIRQETGGSPTLVVYPETIHPGPGGLKAIDALQRLGLVDYWALRARLTAYRFPRGVEPSDYLPWYMDLTHRLVVGPDLPGLESVAERVELRVYKCPRSRGPYRPVAYEAGGVRVESGPCDSWVIHEAGRATVAVVTMSLDEDHREIEILEPQWFAEVVRTSRSEEEKIEALHRMMEEAVRAPTPEAVDRVVKRYLEEYFNEWTPAPLRDPPARLLGLRTSCPRASHCIDDAVSALDSAVEWLGMHGVTLAVQDEEVLAQVLREYASRTGRPFQGHYQGAYKRVLAASRDGPYRLMDYGFIVALVRGGSRRSVLVDRLEGYPYAAVFTYNMP